METIYFAFGSNMCPAQMVRRCPSAVRIGAGVLPDHTLRFPRRGAVWSGGIADAAPEKGQEVHGVIYELSPEDMELLDGFEVSYDRAIVEVVLQKGQSVDAVLYRLKEPLGHFPPGRAYLETMIRGARLASIPEPYIARLESLLAEARE